MSEEVELMLLADVRSLESEVGRMAKRLAEATVKLVSLKAERDTLVHMLVSEFGWSDTSYLHAAMHVENAIRNLRADARAARAERDELHKELEQLHRLAPTGTYTLNVAHEEEIQRLTKERDEARANYAFMVERAANEKLDGYRELGARAAAAENERDDAKAKAAEYERDWYAAKSEFGTAMAKMREALRAAEKRELEALAELDEARAALQRVVEYDSDPDQSWSDLMSWCREALK